MEILVDKKAGIKCYAVLWSYGQICVGCNCCGRDSKGLNMWKDRLKYHRSILQDKLQFKSQLDEGTDLFEYQAKIVKENIKFHRRKIRFYKRMIEKYSNNQRRNKMKANEILKRIHSMKLCMMAHLNNEPDSEFVDRINDLNEIENALNKAIDSKIDKLPKMSFEEAEKESKCCDYAIDAVEMADDNGIENEINWVDAASFFLEGYKFAQYRLNKK